jgi:hypothetical protein
VSTSPIGKSGSSRNVYWNTAPTRGSAFQCDSAAASSRQEAAASPPPATAARGVGAPDRGGGRAAAARERALERGDGGLGPAGQPGEAVVDRPGAGRADDVPGQVGDELGDADPDRRGRDEPGEVAEQEPVGPAVGVELGAHRPVEAGVDARGQRRRTGLAAGALRADERRVVGLVPRAPPRELEAGGAGERQERADQRPVGGHGRRRERPGGGRRPGARAAAGWSGGPGRDAVDHDDRGQAGVRGDRGEQVAQAGVGGARRDAALAAGVGGREGRRVAGPGLELGPVDDDAQVGGAQRGDIVAPGAKAGGQPRAGGGAPEEVGVGLSQPDRDPAAGAGAGSSARERRAGGGAPAGGEEGGKQAGKRRPDGQTGEQDSVPATRKEDPQPQAATTLGLFTLKPAPIRAST